jgi:hypothetical protein
MYIAIIYAGFKAGRMMKEENAFPNRPFQRSCGSTAVSKSADLLECHVVSTASSRLAFTDIEPAFLAPASGGSQ